MNKLIYLALAAACFSMAGCSNDDAPNVDRTTDDDWISEDGRVVIQLESAELIFGQSHRVADIA
ncbi:MAG: hypothetical protein ACI4C3_10110, partial [Bacteroides sp.]